MVKYYIDNGVNVNVYDRNAYSALWKATRDEEYDLVKTLIECKANVNLRNNETSKYDEPPRKETSIYCAISTKNLVILEYLLQHGANPNMKRLDPEGETALSFAISHSKKSTKETDLEIVRTLLKYGADPNNRDGLFGDYPLYWAILTDMYWCNGQNDFAKLLMKYNARTDIRHTSDGEHVLVFAIQYKNYDLLKMLVNNGANVNATAYKWKRGTILEYSEENGDIELSKILISAGAKKSIKWQ